MLTISSQHLQAQFNEVSHIVQSHQPVVITQSGRPTMMLIPYDEGMEILRQYHAQQFVAFLGEQATLNQSVGDKQLAEINQLIEQEREFVYQEKLKNHATSTC